VPVGIIVGGIRVKKGVETWVETWKEAWSERWWKGGGKVVEIWWENNCKCAERRMKGCVNLQVTNRTRHSIISRLFRSASDTIDLFSALGMCLP
jgi:hypothetical protein